MAGYYRTIVVEITITVGLSMNLSRYTLKGKAIETVWYGT